MAINSGMRLKSYLEGLGDSVLVKTPLEISLPGEGCNGTLTKINRSNRGVHKNFPIRTWTLKKDPFCHKVETALKCDPNLVQGIFSLAVDTNLMQHSIRSR